ncbi:MAG: dienelactone hydrolase family protein [Verrucomicrobiales bacterium]|nr:dienelactone hydrolase family protein [Verrucomicrobiales bacterium]
MAADPVAGKQVAVTAKSTSDKAGKQPWRYFLFLPEGYDESAEEKWPLLLYLHGSSLRGNDLKKTKRYGPPSFVEKRPGFPFLTVSPQLPSGAWPASGLTSLLDELLATYPVDPERVYLSGVSLGAMGAWTFAAAAPDRFAALIPICAHGPAGSAAALTDMPIWAFHGAKDYIVPIGPHRKLIEAIKGRGGNARLTVYPEGDHGSVIAPTYKNPELIQWILEQKREQPQTALDKSE